MVLPIDGPTTAHHQLAAWLKQWLMETPMRLAAAVNSVLTSSMWGLGWLTCWALSTLLYAAADSGETKLCAVVVVYQHQHTHMQLTSCS